MGNNQSLNELNLSYPAMLLWYDVILTKELFV